MLAAHFRTSVSPGIPISGKFNCIKDGIVLKIYVVDPLLPWSVSCLATTAVSM